jgi:hypothetical protein
VSHFLENGYINCKLQSPAQTRTRMGNPGEMKPVWGQLEIQLADYIVTMRAQRKAMNRLMVLHQALELAVMERSGNSKSESLPPVIPESESPLTW